MTHEARVSIQEIQNTKAGRTREERICLHTYTLDTVKKSCYRFSSSYFVSLESSDVEAIVTFRFPSTVNTSQEEDIIERFQQDILDQDLRESVASQTEVVRNLILANAFSQTDLLDNSDD